MRRFIIYHILKDFWVASSAVQNVTAAGPHSQSLMMDECEEFNKSLYFIFNVLVVSTISVNARLVSSSHTGVPVHATGVIHVLVGLRCMG